MQQARYWYDGDGNMVKSVVNETVTYYIGKLYQKEVDGSAVTVRKHYLVGGQQVAVRTVAGQSDVLRWVLTDHLGSASVTASADGSWNSELRYAAFGETRYSSGITPTEYRYTGQLRQAEVGLYYYGARWYDPYLNHFVQADSIVPAPGNPMAWDRYAYVLNNPLRYTDPSGHYAFEDTPDDPYFRSQLPGVTPAFRSLNTCPVTRSEATSVFLKLINNPLPDTLRSPHSFGDSRGKHNVPGTIWNGYWRWHASIDVGTASDKDETIYPVSSGEVIFSGWDRGGLGNTVVIEHLLYGYKFYSVYGHLGSAKEDDPNTELNETGLLVTTGQQVTSSTGIGLVGNSKPGCKNCAVHLHFEIRQATNIDLSKGNPLNGQRYWAFEGETWQEYFLDLGSKWGYDEDNFTAKINN